MSGIEEMLSKQRTMAIKLNGIWQLGIGVYIDINSSPLKARITLHGRDYEVDEHSFLDFHGYRDEDAQAHVISRNIQTLPKLVRKKKEVPFRDRLLRGWVPPDLSP